MGQGTQEVIKAMQANDIDLDKLTMYLDAYVLAYANERYTSQ